MTPAQRLRSTPGVQRVPNPKLDLFIVRDFLDDAACAGLIERIDARRRPSEISDDQGIMQFRTSETCDLDPADPLVAAVDGAIGALLGIAPETGEPIQGQRYAPGQEFKAHTDTFEPGGADYYAFCADSGNRAWTAMIYLNRPDDGGATRFKAIGKTIQPETGKLLAWSLPVSGWMVLPETGKLLAWSNLLPDGRPNPATLHQGMRVRRGTKYIVTKWYREGAFPG